MIYKKEETAFPFNKKAKEKVSFEETDHPADELETDLALHYENSPQTLKTLKVIYEISGLNISFEICALPMPT